MRSPQRTPIRSDCVAIVLVALVALGAHGQAPTARSSIARGTAEPPTPERPGGVHANGVIRLEPGILDLGELVIGETGKGVVRIVNTSDAPVTIERVMPSCGCTTAPAPKEPILPGESAELPVSLRAGARQGAHLDKRVTVVVAGHPPVLLSVRARVGEYIGLDPDILVADSTHSDSATVRLTSLDGTPFRVLNASPRILAKLPEEPAVEHELRVDWLLWERSGKGVRLDLEIDHPRMKEVAVLIRRHTAGAERDARAERAAAAEGASARRPPREHAQLVVGAKLGLLTAIDAAIRNGALVDDVEFESGRTALHWAASEGHTDVVEALLDLGATIDTRDRAGKSALGLAAEAGRDDVVRTLIAHGTNVNHRDVVGGTPLLLAAGLGTSETVGMLIEAGADVRAADRNGMTPLLWAAGIGDPQSVTLLLAAGADPAARDRLSGEVALVRAARGTRDASVAALLAHGGIDLSTPNLLGMTALHQAVIHGGVERVKLLIDAGADLSATCRRGWTPLDHARNRMDDGATAMIEYLERMDAPSGRD